MKQSQRLCLEVPLHFSATAAPLTLPRHRECDGHSRTVWFALTPESSVQSSVVRQGYCPDEVGEMRCLHFYCYC